MAVRKIVGNLKFPLMTVSFVGIFESETQFVYLVQWRIQDFPGGGGCANSQKCYYFFAENCMKMKEFGPPGGASLAPPLRSADVVDKSQMLYRIEHEVTELGELNVLK